METNKAQERNARKAYRIVFLKSDVNNEVTWHVSDRSDVSQFMPGHAEVFSGLLYLSKHLPESSHPFDPRDLPRVIEGVWQITKVKGIWSATCASITVCVVSECF